MWHKTKMQSKLSEIWTVPNLYFLLRTWMLKDLYNSTGYRNHKSESRQLYLLLSPICGEMRSSEALFCCLLKMLRQINVGQNNPQESQHIKHEFQGTLHHRFTQDSGLLPDLPNIEIQPPTTNQTHIYCQARNIKPYAQKHKIKCYCWEFDLSQKTNGALRYVSIEEEIEMDINYTILDIQYEYKAIKEMQTAQLR